MLPELGLEFSRGHDVRQQGEEDELEDVGGGLLFLLVSGDGECILMLLWVGVQGEEGTGILSRLFHNVLHEVALRFRLSVAGFLFLPV